MKISYGFFDGLLEVEMGDLVFGGDVTEHIFEYYVDEVLDDNMIHTIQNHWVEVELEDVEEEKLVDLLGDKNTLITYLTKEGILNSKSEIDIDTLFISNEVPGRIAWKQT